MTFPAITADGQTHVSGGVKYTSILAEKRWKRAGLVPNYQRDSVTEQVIATGAITPAKINIAVTFASSPPGSPATGIKYLIRPTATGAWEGKENQLAEWVDGAWQYTLPREGMIAWDPVGDLLYAYNGTAWGPVNQFTLPDRLLAGGKEITNWNTALENGFYWSAVGALNVPSTAIQSLPLNPGKLVYGVVQQAGSSSNLEQVVAVWDGSAAQSDTYSRTLSDGSTWSSWVKRNLTSDEVSTLITNAVNTYVTLPEDTDFKVISRATSNPPGSPSNGDRYIVPSTGTGAWATHGNQVATWSATAAAWTFSTLAEGVPFWVADEDKWIVFDGTTFVIIGPQPNNGGFRFQYRLIDAVGASFGPLNSDTDFLGQAWTAVFPSANLGSGTRYYGLANNSGAGNVNANVGPEATAIRVNGENLWLYSASYTASASPYAPGDDEPSIGF